MDILHVNKKEMREMELKEYQNAVEYSWTTYLKRDINYNLYKFFQSGEGDKNKSFGDVDWTPINPVEQELQKRRKIPPAYKKYLDSLEKKNE